MTSKVTIVIPFFNDPYIPQAVESALTQTYHNIEIIVVDDGSMQYAPLLKPYLSHIYYLGKSNGGTASALNHGIRNASGDYIVWLSSDDMLYPNKIKEQLMFMHENQSFISHTNFNIINGSSHITQHTAGIHPYTEIELYTTLLGANPINGCTIMFKKDIVRSVGLFNEALRYTHDIDLWYRVILSGYSLHYLNQCQTAYRWHPNMGTIRHQTTIEKELHETQIRYQSSLRRLIASKGG
ncbi:glycosyltransferase family 2 protein [Paenibacillus sp. CMAA1364]